MRISDGSSDVCSSDLAEQGAPEHAVFPSPFRRHPARHDDAVQRGVGSGGQRRGAAAQYHHHYTRRCRLRSEEHTSELQSLMRISYAVFCLKKKNKQKHQITTDTRLETLHYTTTSIPYTRI